MFKNLFKKKALPTMRRITIIKPEDEAKCVAAIEKWYKQQNKKDMRGLILIGPLYKGSDLSVPIGYSLELVSDKYHLDISDFWEIYNSIENECNV